MLRFALLAESDRPSTPTIWPRTRARARMGLLRGRGAAEAVRSGTARGGRERGSGAAANGRSRHDASSTTPTSDLITGPPGRQGGCLRETIDLDSPGRSLCER